MDTPDHIESLISQGRYLEARYLIENNTTDANAIKSEQLYGLALSKSGMPEDALQRLEALYKTYPDDPETAGILGSVYKELFKKNQQTSFALLARDTYLKNFIITKNYYTGINAAAMSAMIMQGSKSREIANEIIRMIDLETNNFWELATLGEAYLLIKNRTKAIEYYLKARKVAGTDWGKIGSVYNQLWLLNHYIDGNREAMKIFNPPGVVAFAGHMIDHPSRKTARFPAAIEMQIKNSILNSLQTINAHIGFCSIACGSDILFAESMAELGREVNIFLPFDTHDFAEVSVRFAGDQWVQRFNSLIEKFPVNIITEEKYAGDDELFGFQSKVILGSALLRSATRLNKTTLLTVLSETELKQKEGGTNSTLSLWPYRQNHININPDIFVSRNTFVPHSSSEQISETIANRHLVLFVVINFMGLSQFYKDKIGKDLENLNPDSLPLIKTQIEKDILVYAFKSEFNAFDLLDHLQGPMKYLPADQKISITIHSGLIHKAESAPKGEALETAIEINKLSLAGIFVSEHAAALLALQVNKYILDYAGSILTQHARKYSIYRVSMHTK